MRLSVAFLVAALAASAAHAQFVTVPFGGPKKVRPSAGAALRGAPTDIAAAVASRSRPVPMVDLDESRRPVEVLQFLGLPLGARAVVAGADPAYYSEIIAGAVGPGGRVTALVPPAALKEPATRAAMSGVVGRAPTVAILAASFDRAHLDPERFDFALLDRVGAVSPDRAAVARTLLAALRPGAVVGVVDSGDAAAARADFTRAGFAFDGESPVLRIKPGTPRTFESDAARVDAVDRFVLRFHKPE